MKRKFITILAVAATLAATAQSAFQRVITSVLTNNGEVNAALAVEEAALAVARSENSLPGAEIEGEHLWGENGSGNRYSIGVSQEFEMPWVYSARRGAINAQAQAVDYAKAAIWADKALSIKQLIIDIINAKQRLAFYEELGQNLAAIDSLTRRSFELGNATVLDIRKLQLSILDNNRSIDACRADLATLQASLRAQGADFEADAAIWDAYPVQTLTAASTNPEDYYQYHLGRLNAQAAQYQASVIRRQAWPTLALGYQFSYEDHTNFHGLTVTLRLPSYSQRQRRLAADYAAQAIVSQYDFELTQAMSEAAGEAAAAQALQRSIDQYADLSGDTSYLDLLHKAFLGGELSVIDYLNEVNLFKSARLSFIDLDYRYQLSLARLNRYRSLDFN